MIIKFKHLFKEMRERLQRHPFVERRVAKDTVKNATLLLN